MRPTLQRAEQIVAGLTREQKVRLLSGAGFWTTEAFEEAGVPSVRMADGPHGLRRADADDISLTASAPATCFPTAATLGSTWDPALLEEVGAALGQEARAAGVGVILGPGLNIKRHPAGGRVFEYLSEDPFLSGVLAAALVRGIQSQGVGACLKHFAANNQETSRMVVDTIVDERTLREIYLTGFEIAVRQSSPWAVMSAYNRVNGPYCSDNTQLLTGILRHQWGFDGLVVSDWMATNDRVAAVAAGMDLEMPGSAGFFDGEVVAALDDGSLDVADLDRACARVVDLALRAAESAGAGDETPQHDEHHALARRAAASGMVLLTNSGLLPLSATGRIAVVGAFADSPRYQGNGSSLVNPTRLDTVLDALRAAVGDAALVDFAPGYDARTGHTTPELMGEATDLAASCDVVVLCVGLPAVLESEGYDRDTLALPDGHNDLVEAVVDANPSTVVVMMNGGPVEVDWADRPAAILEAYLGGQAGGSAVADVLLGLAEPGGRLAESVPVSAGDLPVSRHFPGTPSQVEYREGLYVGYRFHDSSGVPARFAFGHGLSYTTFAYGQVEVSGAGVDLQVLLPVTNTGSRSGCEVVQLYVRDCAATVYRPDKELKGFAKVCLDPGETRRIRLALDRRSFAVYDVVAEDWLVEGGEFDLLVGSSSLDIRGSVRIHVDSADALAESVGPAEYVATDEEFAVMIGRAVPVPRPRLPYDRNSTVADLAQTQAGRLVRAALGAAARRRVGEPTDPETAQMMTAVMEQMPLRALAIISGGAISARSLDGVIALLNAARGPDLGALAAQVSGAASRMAAQLASRVR